MKQEKDLRYYWQILLARKPYFIWPALVVFLIGIVVTFALPSVYESTATILIENQQIPADFVPSMVGGFANQRVQTLTQQLLSRPKLQEIVEKFNLFPEMKGKEKQDAILATMRENILVETISDFEEKAVKDRRGMTIAFRVTYRGQDPDTVQKVTDTLGNVFLQTNKWMRQEQAKTTTTFLQQELKEIQKNIRTIGQNITAFKEKHGDILPELQNFNRSQAERLENEIKQIDGQIQAAQDRRIALGGQLLAVNEGVLTRGGPTTTDPVSRLAAVRVELAGLRAKFSSDHPDVLKLLREKAELEKMVGITGSTAAVSGEKISQLQAELAEKQGRYSAQHPEVVSLKKEIAELAKMGQASGSQQTGDASVNPAYVGVVTNVKTVDSEINMLQKRRADAQQQLKEYRRRLAEGPKVEQEYLALTRDYENATRKHQDVMNQIMTARISEGMEESQKGERFTLLEAASYPGEPAWPNRPLFFLASLILSLGAGLAGVFLIEQVDHSVRGAEELAWLTGLPVLGRLSLMETAEDLARKSQRRRLNWSIAGLFAVIGIVVVYFLARNLWQ
jgi:polysaccharide biosynthesis transport protein